MQAFMPGTQPRGTHAFDPGSLPCISTNPVLNEVNEEDDGEEDRLGPPVDTSGAKIPESFISAMVSSLLPTQTASSSSFTGSNLPVNATSPPSSSSISPTTHLDLAANPSPVSAPSRSTGITTNSVPNSGRQLGKRKHDSTGDKRSYSASAKRVSKNKTDGLNPVIISNALNSTLNRLADVMEKSLDATTTSVESQTTQPPLTTPQPPQTLGPSSTPLSASASSSRSEIVDQVFRIITADNDFLSEDQLLAASMLFTSDSEDVVRIGQSFIALGKNPVVQRRFLLRQLEDTGFLQGKGKGKASDTQNDDDILM
jgi:hypothetical protein